MAQLKEGSIIKKSTGDEIIATETQLNNHNTDVAAHNDIRQQINTLDADVVAHKDDYMPHRFQDLKNDKIYKFGFQINENGNPQIIFEEVI